MEANEKSMSVNVEDQQVMHPYFSEYAPVGSIDHPEGIVSEYNRMYKENLLNCILLWNIGEDEPPLFLLSPIKNSPYPFAI